MRRPQAPYSSLSPEQRAVHQQLTDAGILTQPAPIEPVDTDAHVFPDGTVAHPAHIIDTPYTFNGRPVKQWIPGATRPRR
jgi:hypothetical protein